MDQSIARIRTIDEHEASGTLKELYEEMLQRRGQIPNIRRALSLRPEVIRGLEAFTSTITRGGSSLGRVREELIATVVSALNQCEY